MDNHQQRLLKALTALAIAVTVGTLGFWAIEGGEATLFDCFYMTIITLSTVGYGEVIPLDVPGRVFSAVLIIFGMGSLIYFGSTLLAFWVEFDLRGVRRRKRMQNTIDRLAGHIVVCGVGVTGHQVMRELLESQTPFVIVEIDQEKITHVREMHTGAAEAIPYVHGDATEDWVLKQAGIERASGVVAALRNDKDNLYLILSARQLNPALRIVARAMEKDAPPKMLRAGADRVVAPNLLGGTRIASEMIRPDVVEFLDVMLRDREQNTRIEQVSLPPGSALVGRRLADTRIRQNTDVLVIALRDDRGLFIYNPGPETVLTEGATLIVLGARDSVIKLRDSLEREEAGLVHHP
ncbi:MAG TPA: potassium channel protein [Polyangia bacterium]|nr:potassium channel protein [Polyangia bacterium]